MRSTIQVPLGALFLFCAIQLLALYLWLPPRVVQQGISRGHSDRRSEDHEYLQHGNWNQTSLASLEGSSNLPSGFALLAQEGRKRGLSDADLMALLLHALSKEVGSSNETGLIQSIPSRQGGINLKKSLLPPNTPERLKFEPKVAGVIQKTEIKPDGYSHLESYPWDNITEPVNPHDFRLVINQPDLCRTNGSVDDVFLLVLMISQPSDAEQRQKQRDTCLSVRDVSGRTIRHVFLLGDSGKAGVTDKVKEEAARLGDIVMEDFKESYRNLTLKTLMGLKWASVYCPQAQYVIKTDDDVFLSLTNIVHLLEKSARERFMTGYVYRGTKPLRDKRYKWYISKELYPRDIYPPYCCGIGYILSQDIVPWVYTKSLTIPYIFLEDAFVGLCVEKLNVVPTTNPGFFPFRSDYDYCKFKTANVVHLKKIHDIDKFWVQQQTKPANVTC